MNAARAALWGGALLLVLIGAWFALGPENGDRVLSGKEDQDASVGRLNDKAIRLLEDGRLDEAIELFRRARALDPRDRTLARNLSLALARKASTAQDGGDATQAKTFCEEALGDWPENPEALELLTSIHYRAGRYGQARDLAARIAAFYPDRPNIGAFVADLTDLAAQAEGTTTEAGDRFRIRYSGQRRLEFEGELVSAFQQEMDALSASLGIFPKDPVEIILLTEDLGERAARFDPYVSGLYDGRIRLYLGKGMPPRPELLKIVRHELVHALLHRVGRETPVWFQEGVAQFYGEDFPEARMRDLRESFASAVARGWRFDLSGLTPSFLSLPPEDRSLAYVGSLLFVDRLIRNCGRNLVPVTAAEMAHGASFEEALRTATGAALEDLRAEFLKSL